MKFEALKPIMEPPADDERQAKIAILEQFQLGIEALESTKESLEEAIANSEKSGDWSGVARIKNLLQKDLSTAKSLQRKIEGKESALTIEANYHYKNEKGKDATDSVEISFDASLEAMADLYQKYGVEILPDFAEQMKEIWERNSETMTEAISEKGFNKALFIPANLPNSKDLEQKLTADYEKEKGNKTYWGFEAKGMTEAIGTGARIVLVHDSPDLTTHPELKKTLGKKFGGEKENGKNNKAEDFIKDGESLTLSEYLILQRDVFDKTGVHIDSKLTPDGSYIYCTWLPGSRVGASVVCASWHPGLGRLDVNAFDPVGSSSDIGCRPSRCFQ